MFRSPLMAWGAEYRISLSDLAGSCLWDWRSNTVGEMNPTFPIIVGMYHSSHSLGS